MLSFKVTITVALHMSLRRQINLGNCSACNYHWLTHYISQFIETIHVHIKQKQTNKRQQKQKSQKLQHNFKYLQFDSKFLFDFTFNQVHPLLLQFIIFVMKLLLHSCQIFGDGLSHNTIHPLKKVRTFGEHRCK